MGTGLTGGGGLISSGSIPDGTVALADMANLAQDQFIGRVSTSTGVPETATITAAARSVLDDTSVGAMATTIGAAQLAGTAAFTAKQTFSAAAVCTPVVLTDAATIATNAALGNVFTVTLGASRTMGVPTNPTAGQTIRYEITQGGSGSYTITWTGGASGFDFTTSNPAPTLSTSVGKCDVITFVYLGTLAVWRGVANSIDD